MTRSTHLLLQAAIAVVAAGSLLAQANPDKNPLEAQFHRYIPDHPEVIDEALNLLQARQQQAAQQHVKTQIAAEQEKLFGDPGSPVAGDAGGVTLVEFFDYRCGYCKKMAPNVLQLIEKRSNVRVVFKEISILGGDSLEAAKASLAANKQGAYLQFHKALFAASEPITLTLIDRIAGGLKLDVAKLHEDMQSQEVKEVLERNQQLASKLNIDGTPSFVIGNEIIPGAIEMDDLERRITAASAGKDAPKTTAQLR